MHRGLLSLSLFVLTFCACGLQQTTDDAVPVEMRGVWLTNVDSDVFDSRDAIEEALAFLDAHNFNTIFPVVWHNGYTLYPSGTMDDYFDRPGHPDYAGRDLLQEVIDAAAPYDIAVVPWFEFGFSSDNEADGPGHILQARPEWAARDSSGDILLKNGFRWMNAYHPEVQEFVANLVLEVAESYDVDGVQGDDRLPAQPVEGGYAPYTRNLYAQQHDGQEPPSDVRNAQWMRWRASQLNAFAERLYTDVKAVDSTLWVSWAPSVYPWSYEEYLQDWPSWITGGYADLVHAQVYRRDLGRYRETLKSLHPDSIAVPPEFKEFMSPGLLVKAGSYVIGEEQLLEAININRSLGYAGEVHFFYEGLRENNDRLASRLIETVYADAARSPLLAQSP
jgi:uncharacterized lipoprotein YddW (UPF0748 family)